MFNGILGYIIGGAVIGILARLLKPGADPVGWIMTIVLGILGAVAGGWASTQFGLGGADSVRGFLEREISDDWGYRTTVELYSPDFGGKTGIASARTRALIFFDAGHVDRNHPAPAETFSQGVASYGIGLRFAKGTDVALRVDYGIVADPNAVHTRGSGRLHASFSYIF